MRFVPDEAEWPGNYVKGKTHYFADLRRYRTRYISYKSRPLFLIVLISLTESTNLSAFKFQYLDVTIEMAAVY
jgi:hypothetical protein